MVSSKKKGQCLGNGSPSFWLSQPQTFSASIKSAHFLHLCHLFGFWVGRHFWAGLSHPWQMPLTTLPNEPQQCQVSCSWSQASFIQGGYCRDFQANCPAQKNQLLPVLKHGMWRELVACGRGGLGPALSQLRTFSNITPFLYRGKSQLSCRDTKLD